MLLILHCYAGSTLLERIEFNKIALKDCNLNSLYCFFKRTKHKIDTFKIVGEFVLSSILVIDCVYHLHAFPEVLKKQIVK